MTPMQVGQWHECRDSGFFLIEWSMTPMHLVNDTNAGYWVWITPSGQWHECILVNDTNAVRQAFLHFLIERSMTPMHLVNDTNACHWVWITLSGQWHECSETGFFAPPYRTVNDTNAFGQWHECRSLCVNHTQSMTRMQFGQWHECRDAGFFVSP